MAALPPPPVTDVYGSFTWLEWFRQLRAYITQNGSVPWSIIDFAGSNITSIANRAHNSLQSLQGGTPGQYYHLTAAEQAVISAIPSGITGTIPLAKLTTTGSNGSLTFTSGILTSKLDPT